MADMAVNPVKLLRLALWLNLMVLTGAFLVQIEVGGLSSAGDFEKGFFSSSSVIMLANWRSGICLYLWLR